MPNIRPVLRDITPGDYNAVLEVYRRSEDFLSLGPQPKASLDMVVKDLEECKGAGGVVKGIFTTGVEMAGIISYVPAGFEGKSEDAFIFLLMIAVRYRGQGIGSKTLCQVEKDIRRDPGVTAILSAVQVNNPLAMKFWRKHGYQMMSSAEPRPDKTVVYRLKKKL